MTTQVVVFSLLLFGASGMVLDFGRVYSEHSAMQTFTDQAALAAAAELDLRPGAVTRARHAVFGRAGEAPLSKRAAFSSDVDGDADFAISHLIFISALGRDRGEQFRNDDIYSVIDCHATGDSDGRNCANGVEYFIAFPGGGGQGSLDEAEIELRASYVVAVARMRSVRNSLLRLVNMAGDDIAPEATPVRAIAVAQRRTQICGRFSNWAMCNPWEADPALNFTSMTSASAEGLQFRFVADGEYGDLSTPQRLARMAILKSAPGVETICDDDARRPGAGGATSLDAERARTVCKLSATTHPRYCVGDRVTLAPAEAGDAATAFGLLFDIWDPPMASVLAWDRDAAGRPSSDPAWDGASAHPLRSSSALFQPDANIFKGRRHADVDDDPATTAFATGPRAARRNFFGDEQSYNLKLAFCLRTPEACGGAMVDGPVDFFSVDAYFQANFQPYLASGGAYPSVDASSFNRAHIDERDNWLVTPTGDSGATNGADGLLSRENQTRNTAFFTYTPIDASPKRRMSVAVVNCGGYQTDDNGVTQAPIVDFVDLHILRPPKVVCPGGGEQCLNDSIPAGAGETTIHAEFIGLTNARRADYAVLAR